jgi:hypothetical protein
LLWLMVVVGLACGWWLGHRQLKYEIKQQRSTISKMAWELFPLKAFPEGDRKIRAILDDAKTAPPPPEAAAEVLHYVLHEKDYRIRTMAMAVLPYLTERAEAIKVLLNSLNERKTETSDEGLVHLYAAKYLTDMNATEAIRPLENWLAYLENESPYDDEIRAIMIKSARRDLKKLKSTPNAS